MKKIIITSPEAAEFVSESYDYPMIIMGLGRSIYDAALVENQLTALGVSDMNSVADMIDHPPEFDSEATDAAHHLGQLEKKIIEETELQIIRLRDVLRKPDTYLVPDFTDINVPDAITHDMERRTIGGMTVVMFAGRKVQAFPWRNNEFGYEAALQTGKEEEIDCLLRKKPDLVISHSRDRLTPDFFRGTNVAVVTSERHENEAIYARGNNTYLRLNPGEYWIVKNGATTLLSIPGVQIPELSNAERLRNLQDELAGTREGHEELQRRHQTFRRRTILYGSVAIATLTGAIGLYMLWPSEPSTGNVSEYVSTMSKRTTEELAERAREADALRRETGELYGRLSGQLGIPLTTLDQALDASVHLSVDPRAIIAHEVSSHGLVERSSYTLFRSEVARVLQNDPTNVQDVVRKYEDRLNQKLLFATIARMTRDQ